MVKYYNNGSGRGSVWLERDVRDVEVAGSNPVAPTKIKENKNDERERNIKLLELQKRISLEENTKMIGKKVDVLVEGASKSTRIGYRVGPDKTTSLFSTVHKTW